MKRFIPFLAIALFFLASCSDDNSTSSGNTPSVNHPVSYFPLDDGNVWTYSQTEVVRTKTSTSTFQIKLLPIGIKEWYNDGGLIAVNPGSWQTFNYQEIYTDTTRNETMWYLTNYLDDKYSWGINGTGNKVVSYRMVNFADTLRTEIVSTNIGSYTCRVAQDDEEPGFLRTYYVAKGVGIIKYTITGAEYSSTCILTSYNIK